MGFYTYYAGQTDGQPSYFTTKFYPAQHRLRAEDSASRDGGLEPSGDAEPILISKGELTDRALNGSERLDTGVTGWNGNTSYIGSTTSAFPGFIDIVFDLGDIYKDISLIVVNYMDSPGHRFDPAVDAQLALFGTTPPDNTEFGGLNEFAKATIVPDTSSGSLIFAAPKPIDARYLVIRLSMSVSGEGIASAGGYINSVQIQTISGQ